MNEYDRLVLLDDSILVKEDEPDEKIGSIIIPDTAKRPTRMGTALVVGRGRIHTLTNEIKPMQVKVGDRLRIYDFTHNELYYEGEKLLLIRESDVAWIEEKEDD